MPDTLPPYNWRLPIGDDFFQTGFTAIRNLASDIKDTIVALAARVTSLEAPGSTWPTAFMRETAVNIASFAAGAYYAVAFNTADTNVGSGFNNARLGTGYDSRWTVPAGQGGTYRLKAALAVNSVTAGNLMAAHFLKNGNTQVQGSGVVLTSGRTDSLILVLPQIDLVLAAGDFIELQGYSNQAWTTRVTTADGIASTMSVTRIR